MNKRGVSPSSQRKGEGSMKRERERGRVRGDEEKERQGERGGVEGDN